MTKKLRLLAVGGTGSVGMGVVEEAREHGYDVRVLARRPADQRFTRDVEVVAGDLSRRDTLVAAVRDIDAIVFTHGTYGSLTAAEAIDFGGVRNILDAIAGRSVRIALMSTIGVTDRKGAHDWKRRAERLVRASGHPYTIVRPGWFDYNAADQLKLVMLQGDKRQSGTPRDGVVSRAQLAEVLVHSLCSPYAVNKTVELVAERGQRTTDIDRLFSACASDVPGRPDGVLDAANMPEEVETA